MNEFICEPGDVLFYFHTTDIGEALIQVGEDLEEHSDGPWPWHVAVALGSWSKIEADGKHVAIHPISYHQCVICRPPYTSWRKVQEALGWARTQEGKLYGWFGLLDQALRDLSGGYLHMPRWLIQWADKRWPYCSTLTDAILVRACFTEVPSYPPPSPADVWKVLKKHVVCVCD